MYRNSLLPLLLAAAALGAGCASTVRIQSEPAGARIRWRGEGRASFRWKDAPAPAPVVLEDVHLLGGWGDPEPLVLRPDPSLPRIGAATAPASGPGARPSGYRSAPAFDKRSVQKGDALAELPPPKLELPPPSED